MLMRAALIPPEESLDELWAATRTLRMVPGIHAVPRDELEIPVTSFGNMLPADVTELADLLRAAFGGAEAPVVRFSGLRLEESATVALGLAGEVEPIADLARFIPEAARTMALFVDRRVFRPMLTFATADPTTSPTLLAGALQPLAEWEGTPWAVPGVSLIRTRWLRGANRSEEYDRILMA